MIKKKREELGMTQETLAQFAEVSVRTVQRVEKGEKISVESLKSIAGILDISWDLLIEKDPQIKCIQEEFSKQAGKFEKSSFFRNKEINKTMLAFGKETVGEKVVDLACGSGLLTEELANNGWKVVAMDITKEMLNIVKKKNIPGVEIIRGNANKLSFDNNEFNGVFTRLSFHHFEDPQNVMREIKRIIKNDGIIVIGDILSVGNIKARKLHNAIEKLRDPSHTNCFSKEEIINFGEKIGLQLCEYKELKYERELKEWTDISGTDLYNPLYVLLENLSSHNELNSLSLHKRDRKIYFTHTWGFFKFKKVD